MIGRTLAHYEILAKLGEGGMGEVYRAHDPRTGRDVALKILPPAFAKDPERLARFRREARTLASLNHRNIAVLYGVEEHEDQPFLVMEIAEGQNLAERIKSGPLSLHDTLEIALQIAEGLEEAHEKGVVHRDLKPANVMVGTDGLVKILDFGLARAYEGQGVADEDDLSNSPTITAAMTQEGTVLGTAAYMSPEQARGRGIDRRSDLWAFGVIFWEMLTGRRLFQGDTVSDTIASILKTDPPWNELPAGTPHGVRRLLERCLERDVRNRLRDIGEARIRLKKWQSDPSSLQESFATAAVVVTKSRGLRWLPWVISAMAGALAVFFGTRGHGDAKPPAPMLTVEIRLEDEENMSASSYSALTLSPDGQHLMWSSVNGLYLRPVASFEGIFLPMPRVSSAVFSPDSRWIAYAHGGRLFRQSVTGGAAIEICEVATTRGLAWVDDETLVMSPDYASGLYVVNIADGSRRELTKLGPGERSHRWPSGVRGHDEVLFMTQFPGRYYSDADIEAVSLEDGRRRIIYRGGAHPRWAPTGHLLFARGNAVFAIRYQPGWEQTQGLAVPVLDGVMTFVGDQELHDGSVPFGFDDQGTLLYRRATSHGELRSQMAWLDLETGDVTTLGEVQIYEGPRVSPDGRHVAVRRGEAAESQVVVLDLDTGAERAITSDRGTKYMGAWSADSRMVYWLQADASGSEFEVRRADRDGSRPSEVVFAHPHMAFVDDVSPDGRWLLLSLWNAQHAYELARIDLGASDRVAETYAGGPMDQFQGRFSPDGTFALHANGRAGSQDFFIRRFPDSGARWRIGQQNTLGDEMHWAATGDAVLDCGVDGLRIHPVSRQDDAVQIGRGELRFQPNWVIRPDSWDVDVHPDGRRLLILVPEERQGPQDAFPIVMKTGWFDELRRIDGGR